MAEEKTDDVGTTENGLPKAIAFGMLERKHAEYDAPYWKVCRALYRGGRRLFQDNAQLETLFPRHKNEPPLVYEERKARAYYINYAGEILDFIVAGLKTDPITLESEPKTAPPYYAEFHKDVSSPGGKRLTMNRLIAEQMLEAMICRRAWTQVDFPLPLADEPPVSEAEQEARGELNAYAFALRPEQVLDWEEDDAGELTWVKICVETNARASLMASPNVITRTYTLYSRTGWARYAITYDRTKSPPNEKTPVPLVGDDVHSFGRVPVLRLELPEGLWAMSKLEGMAREHFNKRCALSWAEYKALFQERYEFLAAPDPVAGGPSIADDESRATNQIHGTGWTQVRAEKDRVEFVGPDTAPFAHAMASCDGLRDEMHRVMYTMALAVDVGKAALRQSGDSKKENRAAHGVVLVGLGEFARDHVRDILATISGGRGDVVEWTPKGMSDFEDDGDASIEDAVQLETVSIPSPTFQVAYKLKLALDALGGEDKVTPEMRKLIEAELKDNLTQEALDAQRPGGKPGDPPVDDGDEGDLEGEEVDPPEDDEPPPPKRGTTSKPKRG